MELDAVQKRLVKSKITPYSILKGTDGSGKTTAAVYRIIYLENNYCIYEQDKILIVAQSKEAIDKVKYLHEVLGEEAKLDYMTLFSNCEDRLYLFTIENIINKYLIEFKKDNNLNLEVIYNEGKRMDIIGECIHVNKILYPDIKILNDKYIDFFAQEIKWMKSCNYMELNAYQNADRIGRRCKKGGGPQRLLKNSREREAVFNVMLSYNEALRKNNIIDNEDKALLALEQAQKTTGNKYTHIVIGECEKLTKVQLDLINTLKGICTYSNVIFILDDKEVSDSDAWFIKGRKAGRLGLDSKPKSYNFKQNYKVKEEAARNVEEAVEAFKYNDLRHKKSFEFIRDMNNISDILLKDEYGGSEYTKDEMEELPIFNDIAAGEPILMNPEVEGSFYIPKIWLKGMRDCFILKVKGDSMINADIVDGDYVIIRKQSFAQNNDIVAADLNGSATLKRLKLSKTEAALMPENEKYKPIPINDEGVRIIGTAVGVLKKS